MKSSSNPKFTAPEAAIVVREWIVTNGADSIREQYPLFNPLWLPEPERLVYHAALNVEERGEVASIVSIFAELEKLGQMEKAGGPGAVIGSDHVWHVVEQEINKLHECWKRREQARIARDLGNLSISANEAQAQLELLADSWVGEKPYEVFSPSEMDAYSFENDPSGLLGIEDEWRWMRKGGAGLIFGPSGDGKSTLTIDASVSWALGKKWFGVSPRHPMKSLIVQAENDFGDVAETMKEIAGRHGIKAADLEGKIVVVCVSSKTGIAFTSLLNRLLKKYQVDLVWIDPLFSFAGQDLSLQQPTSQFLREYLDPVVRRRKVAAFLVHHSGKPPRGQRDRDQLDISNTYFGSVELSAYPRAIMGLHKRGDGSFELFASKRGKRAGLVNLDGDQVERIILKHADKGIGWDQLPGDPEKAGDEQEGGKGRPTADRMVEFVKCRQKAAPYSKELCASAASEIAGVMKIGVRQVRSYEHNLKAMLPFINSLSFK
jgi:AAA domain